MRSRLDRLVKSMGIFVSFQEWCSARGGVLGTLCSNIESRLLRRNRLSRRSIECSWRGRAVDWAADWFADWSCGLIQSHACWQFFSVEQLLEMHSARGSVAFFFLAFVTMLLWGTRKVCAGMVRESGRCSGESGGRLWCGRPVAVCGCRRRNDAGNY